MKHNTCALLVMLALVGCKSASDDNDDSELIDFNPQTASIESIQRGIVDGDYSCEQVVQAYVDRSIALDRKGPELNALLAINEDALKRAKELDIAFAESGLIGPMHCVPVTVKDNINTTDMLTTGGALENNQPLTDAYIVNQIRNAGGIIISKANLHEYAFGYTGGSLLGGVPRNVYDLSKGPGGSSSGTGTAVSASMALVGIGTDTGGSIRVPSSVQGLVGIRPSMRLLSQHGIMPLAPFQDTAGPMCRSVSDCAVFLGAMTGYDSDKHSGQRQQFAIDAPLMTNELQYQVITGADDYSLYLDESRLSGARIGVVRSLFGTGVSADNQQVQSAMNIAIENMEKLGATVEDVEVHDLDTLLTEYMSLSRFEFSYSLTEYLLSWSSEWDNHYRSFAEVHSSGEYLDASIGSFDLYAQMGENRWENDDYLNNVQNRPEAFRTAFLRALNNQDENGDSLGQSYDVLIYPSITGLAGPHGGNPTESGSANRISPFTGFPALTMPVGYVSSEDGSMLPVGLEMLSREFDEGTLIGLAYSYEQSYHPRIEPELSSDMVAPVTSSEPMMLLHYDEEMMN